MSDVPFGFGFGAPGGGDGGDRDKGGPLGPGFDVNQLGQMLSQLGQMLSSTSAGGGAGPVNYQLAEQVAVQKLSTTGLPSASQATAVSDAVHLAEMWLDPATVLPAGATGATAWAPRDWVARTMPTWQRLCDPVATRMSESWVEALPAEARAPAGPLLAMVAQMGGFAFGQQLGGALASLGGEVLTSTDIGLPLGPAGVAALLPASVQTLAEGLGIDASEVTVFLAAREAAHHRLFTHVPWLRQRLLATVEQFARGIRIDTAGLEEMARQIDPMNPQSIEQLLGSGLLEPANTPEQVAALARLEALLALVEGWVDVVVADAVGERLPGAAALRETMRRRRASGGPAEETFATLVGLELRPRKLRAASELWRELTDRRGVEGRDALWSHPDLLPTADDLDDPAAFVARNDVSDPIAEIEKLTEQDGNDPDRNDPDGDGPDGDGPAASGPSPVG